jgi:hypothetical protein
MTIFSTLIDGSKNVKFMCEEHCLVFKYVFLFLKNSKSISLHISYSKLLVILVGARALRPL